MTVDRKVFTFIFDPNFRKVTTWDSIDLVDVAGTLERHEKSISKLEQKIEAVLAVTSTTARGALWRTFQITWFEGALMRKRRARGWIVAGVLHMMWLQGLPVFGRTYAGERRPLAPEECRQLRNELTFTDDAHIAPAEGRSPALA